MKATSPDDGFEAMLFAYKDGKLPDYAFIQTMGTKVDFALASKGGSLEITAIIEGKPASGVAVRIFREIRSSAEIGIGIGIGNDSIRRDVAPVVMTGADGVARFEQLLPGLYTVLSVKGDEKRMRSFSEYGEDFLRGFASGKAKGIAVRLGERSSYRIAMYMKPDEIPLRIIRHDAEWPATSNVQFHFGKTDFAGLDNYGSSGNVDVDSDGKCIARQRNLGLLREEIRFGEGERKWHRGNNIYYGAGGVLALSAALAPIKEPVRYTASHFQPGTLIVDLKDSAGNPARGFVELKYRHRVAVVDASGSASFPSLQSWKYTVVPHIEGNDAIDWGEEFSGLALPTETELQKSMSVGLEQSIEVERNTVKHVVCKPQPVGYIRGSLVLPHGADSDKFGVRLNPYDYKLGATLRYLKDTGEFAAGPFTAGKAHLFVRRSDENKKVFEYSEDVAIEVGKIAHVKFAPKLSDFPPLPSNSISERLTGKVFLPDGKTPALGAMVVRYEAHAKRYDTAGITNATGTIQPRRIWNPGTDEKEWEDGAMIAAWLPGANGVVFAPVKLDGTDLRLILPPACRLEGSVTVGGVAPNGRPGRIRVLAAPQEQGCYEEVLAVQTTAQEDGRFELAGLTPGKYRVQATLDDIWLSPSATIEVGERALEPLNFTIGIPGGPVRIKLLNADGKPAIQQDIILIRPEGPLASKLWLKTWRTDGAGEIYIPALEAGKHKVIVSGKEYEITSLALPVENPNEVQLTLDR